MSLVNLVLLSALVLIVVTNASTTIVYAIRGVSFKKQTELVSMRVAYLGMLLYAAFVITVILLGVING